MPGRSPSASISPVTAGAPESDDVDRLVERAGTAAGHPALSEGAVLSWRSGRRASGLLSRRDGAPIGFAQIDRRGPAASIEVVVAPEEQDQAGVRRGLLQAAVDTATANGAEEIRYWVTQHDANDDREAVALGFAAERDLLQLRVPLPLQVERADPPPGFDLRAFRPGEDEAAWLEVNNRAFATHPEQSDWSLEELLEREGADWFDPEGFLLCEADGRLAASCWTKVHRSRRPTLGEIYVISVDPDFQGLGLGRLLAIAGLDWLAGRAEVGMLYVEQSNTTALALYEKLGFTLDHLDRCYLLGRGGPRRAPGYAPVPSPTPRPIP